MNASDDAGGTDVSEQTEPTQEATEQTAESTSYQDALLKIAEGEGHTLGDKPPETEPEPEAPETPEEESKVVEGISEGKDSEDDEEEEGEEEPEEKVELKPAAKEDKLVPLREVLEERGKRKRERDRAEKAEALAEQLKAQLSQVVAPQPTEDNPFIDVNDINALAKLEKSYEKAIDLADDNPDGAEDVLVGIKDGKEVRRDFAPEELVAIRKKADKAIRKFIPERRTYLQQRANYDAEAVKIYPEFQDPESEFTQVAAVVAQKIMTGQAAKDPQLLVAIGDYARGYLSRIKGNSSPTVKTPEARRIMESAKQKIAPTPVRSRSIPERKSSVSLDKAAKKVESEGTQEAAEEYLNALWSKKGGSSRRVETVSE